MKNEELRKTYNKIAKDWNSDHSGDDWWIKGADAFSSLLPQGSSVIDIGCGGGYKTEYIKQKGLSVEGIDFSEGMIVDAKKKFPDIDFKVFDVYDLDNLGKTYDGIFCQAVLLHIPKKDILLILEKMKGILNDGGLLYIAVKEIKENGAEEEIMKENDYGYEYERFFSYYLPDEVRGYFKELDLEIIYEDFNTPSRTKGKTKWLQIIGKKSIL